VGVCCSPPIWNVEMIPSPPTLYQPPYAATTVWIVAATAVHPSGPSSRQNRMERRYQATRGATTPPDSYMMHNECGVFFNVKQNHQEPSGV
jgi:hypothetical protein